MAYNSKNYLLKVKDVMEIYKEYQKKGYSNIWIYRNHIKERFKISVSTFYNYMCIPYERELMKFEDKEKDIETKKHLN